MHISEKRVNPGDVVSIARHKYRFDYSPRELGAVGPPPPEELPSDLFDRPLLDRAGLDLREKKDKARQLRRQAKAPSKKRPSPPEGTD